MEGSARRQLVREDSAERVRDVTSVARSYREIKLQFEFPKPVQRA